jgi:hypothetical protein
VVAPPLSLEIEEGPPVCLFDRPSLWLPPLGRGGSVELPRTAPVGGHGPGTLPFLAHRLPSFVRVSLPIISVDASVPHAGWSPITGLIFWWLIGVSWWKVPFDDQHRRSSNIAAMAAIFGFRRFSDQCLVRFFGGSLCEFTTLCMLRIMC